MAHDVFISYASYDKPIADAACARLEAAKIRCWIAPRDVLAGVPYGEALTEALAGSRMLVLVLSARSNESQHVMREVEGAVTRGIPIIPFRIENVQPSKSLDYFLKSIHWLDAVTPPLERHLATLSETVRVVLERGEAEPVEAQASANEAVRAQQALSTAGRARRFAGIKANLAIAAALLLVIAVIGVFAWPYMRPVPELPAEAKGSSAPKTTSGEGVAQTAAGGETSKTPVALPVSPEEAVRQAIARHYAALCNKDLPALLATYRSTIDAKTLATRKSAMEQTIADTGKIELKRLDIENIEVEEDLAKARVTVLLSALDIYSRQPYFSDEPMIMDFNLSQEGTDWKVVGYKFTNYDEISAKLAPDSIRALIARHFDQFRTKNLEAFLATFRKSMDAESLAKRQQTFQTIANDTGKVEVKQLTLGDIVIEGETATVKASVVLSATDLRRGGPYFPSEPFEYDFLVVRDPDGWRISSMGITVPGAETGSGENSAPVKRLKFQDFASPDGRVKAKLPGEFKQKAEDWGNGIKGDEFSVFAGDKRFVLTYADFPESDIVGKDPLRLLWAFASGYRKDADFQGVKEFAYGPDQLPAREYWLQTSDNLFIRERLLLSGRRLLILFIVSPDDKAFLTSSDADEFFDSLEIVAKP